MNRAYDETVEWKHNLFNVPRGEAGPSFVRELSRLINAYSDAIIMGGFAPKAAMVLLNFLLQKPHPKSRRKDHISRLVDRLTT